jgi:hypothetical protein
LQVLADADCLCANLDAVRSQRLAIAYTRAQEHRGRLNSAGAQEHFAAYFDVPGGAIEVDANTAGAA